MKVFEFKASKAPKPGRDFWTLLETLKPETGVIASPVDQPYTYRQGVRVHAGVRSCIHALLSYYIL